MNAQGVFESEEYKKCISVAKENCKLLHLEGNVSQSLFHTLTTCAGRNALITPNKSAMACF